MCKELLDIENVDCGDCKHFPECEGNCVLEQECGCEECTCNEEEIEDDGVQALQELVEQVLEDILKVDIDTNEVQNMPIDKSSFEEGVRMASKWGGAISVYKTLNLDDKSILELVLNQQTAEYNLKQQEVINQGQIDLAKQTQI